MPVRTRWCRPCEQFEHLEHCPPPAGRETAVPSEERPETGKEHREGDEQQQRELRCRTKESAGAGKVTGGSHWAAFFVSESRADEAAAEKDSYPIQDHNALGRITQPYRLAGITISLVPSAVMSHGIGRTREGADPPSQQDRHGQSRHAERRVTLGDNELLWCGSAL